MCVFFGRWVRTETLLDPDDVAAGHVIRFRRAASDRVVRSRRPAHPAIVSVATFTRAQVLRQSRAAGGLVARRKLERGPRGAEAAACAARVASSEVVYEFFADERRGVVT